MLLFIRILYEDYFKDFADHGVEVLNFSLGHFCFLIQVKESAPALRYYGLRWNKIYPHLACSANPCDLRHDNNRLFFDKLKDRSILLTELWNSIAQHIKHLAIEVVIDECCINLSFHEVFFVVIIALIVRLRIILIQISLIELFAIQ